MARKRSAHTRSLDRFRKRRKRPRPTSGWPLSELAELAGIPRRTVRYYRERGLIPSPQFRGTWTRYEAFHLLRLLTIAYFKDNGIQGLAALQRALDRTSRADMEAIVLAARPSQRVLDALKLRPPAAQQPPAPSPQPTRPVTTMPGALSSASGVHDVTPPRAAPDGNGRAPSSELRGEPCQRVALLPGLELLLSDDASPVVRDVAGRFHAYCVSHFGNLSTAAQ